MTYYKHCAFLGDDLPLREPQGRLVHVYGCTNPKSLWRICLLSHPCTKKRIGGVCPHFRNKSIMNSFGAGKEDGNGQMRT